MDIPKEFGFQIEKAKEIEKTVSGNLKLLKDQGVKLREGYEKYCGSDTQRDRDDMAETLNSRLNHFTQAFKDLMAFIRINNDDFAYDGSLRYFIDYFDGPDISHGGDIMGVVELMKSKNDLIHDYFNIQKNNENLLKGMQTYGSGFEELAECLKEYCETKFPLRKMQEDIKNVVKKSNKGRKR